MMMMILVLETKEERNKRKGRDLDQVFVLDFRQHSDLSCKPAVSFGNLFRGLSSFYYLNRHCLVPIPKHKTRYSFQSNITFKHMK